ncbi:magnesium transporter [Natronospira bacteriovora]|uniref:Magnesium transporter MgtE n=1 Tax=Natronospira bacteriovora TaxID=3069753 RepID=A0ABU0W8U6_9GAMM|nr:magnesium transporter [Natronospira sp. AB-CW4]MDQ2070459.1 magnesium transporter [Natronospira sp. AB-CW4]
MEGNKDLLIEVRELLEQEKWAEVKHLLEDQHIQDISHVLSDLDDDLQHRVFKVLDRPLWAEVFAYLDHRLQIILLDRLSQEEGRYILQNMAADDRTAFLERLPEEEMRNLLRLLPPRDVKQALRLLGYPEESVGRLMTPHFVAVRPEWSIAQAMAHIREQSEEGETVNVIYVTDDNEQLLDMIELKRFILGKPEEKVERIMDDDVVSVTVTDDREEAVQKIQHYDIEALPVADDKGRLVGIVTVDDVFDVAEAESTEDFQKMGSVGVLNLSLKDAQPSLLYRKRVGWLVLLVFVNLFSGAAIAYFEATIEAVIALVIFMPMLMASGGNAGAQASTLMVRALGTGDVHPGDWLRMLLKEFGVAAALGITMGLCVSVLGLWRAGEEVAMVVAFSMFSVVVAGSLLGTLLPFILQKLKLDPASASAPLITTMIDIIGIMIYFSIATAILTLPDAGAV